MLPALFQQQVGVEGPLADIARINQREARVHGLALRMPPTRGPMTASAYSHICSGVSKYCS